VFNDYHFITHWRVRGTVKEIIDILSDAEDLPRWWPSVYIEVKKSGDIVELFTKGWLPYTLRWSFRVLETKPSGFIIEAFGDFVGRGEWTLTQSGDDVDIIYDWHIRAEKTVLKLFSPILKPIFAANHRWAMSRGEESLKIELARRHGEPHGEPPKATFR
jgi:hypothetical protein